MDKKPKNFKECEICDLNANYLCYKCYSYYCDKCYKYIHENNKKSNHIKENIDPFIQIDLKCQKHPIYPMFFFCSDDKGKLISNKLF
jgi:hypothetical protein